MRFLFFFIYLPRFDGYANLGQPRCCSFPFRYWRTRRAHCCVWRLAQPSDMLQGVFSAAPLAAAAAAVVPRSNHVGRCASGPRPHGALVARGRLLGYHFAATQAFGARYRPARYA